MVEIRYGVGLSDPTVLGPLNPVVRAAGTIDELITTLSKRFVVYFRHFLYFKRSRGSPLTCN